MATSRWTRASSLSCGARTAIERSGWTASVALVAGCNLSGRSGVMPGEARQEPIMAHDPVSAFERFVRASLDDLLSPGENSDGFPEMLALLRRAAENVPAYREMLKAASLSPGDIHDAKDFARLPPLTKDNYVRRFPLEALVEGGDLAACDFFAVSSGSTGEPTVWPRGLSHEFPIAVRFEQVLRDSFRAHQRRTLAVVCFALGSWVGGMYTTSCLRWIAAKG